MRPPFSSEIGKQGDILRGEHCSDGGWDEASPEPTGRQGLSRAGMGAQTLLSDFARWKVGENVLRALTLEKRVHQSRHQSISKLLTPPQTHQKHLLNLLDP